ncbi:MAG: alpha/beta fold hydrolase [Nevskiales bacterium]
MRHWKLAPVAFVSAATLLLAACGGGGGDTGKGSQTFSSLVLFDPTNASAIIPFPFDGLFSGATTPTLNVPGTPAPLSDINQLDGFSTTASIFADIAGTIDYKTLPGHVLIINGATGAVLQQGTDFTIDAENATAADPLTGQQTPISSQRSRLLISPLKPLAGATTYLVAITKGIKTTAGADIIGSDSFRITSSATPVAQQTDPALANFTATQKATLEALRSQLIYPVVQALSAKIPADQLALAWSFTTQSIDTTLQLVAKAATATVIQVAPTGLSTGQSGIPGLGFASVYAGVTALPYNLAVPTPTNPTAALTAFWHADPSKPDSGDFAPTRNSASPVPCAAFVAVAGLTPSASTTACFPQLDASKTSLQTVPVLVTVPNAKTGLTKPAGGWPVVIFQHGITQNRENIFAVADGLARAGFVVVAMDLPLHGVTNKADPFYRNTLFTGSAAAGLITGERTFDLDLENNSTSAPGPDGNIDSSGTYFINLQSLITSRDNLREAVSNLLTLSKTVTTLDLDGDHVADTDPNRVYYFGHSLGGIVGGTLLGVNSSIRAAVLANPGGGVGRLLDASKSFGPVISAGLSAAGLKEGTDDYETFLRFAQTLVDSGDPVNYGANASANHAIDLIEVINDLVVPNGAPSTCPVPLPAGISSAAALVTACPGTATEDVAIQTGYLSGTDPLIAAQGLTVVGPLTVPVASPPAPVLGTKLNYAVKFGPGANGTVGHSTVLDPTNDPLVTQEMQSEAAQFLASDGRCLAIAGSCAP